MEYEGLTKDDLENVRALNLSWLELQRGAPEGARKLSVRQLDRLSCTPFLLFSFHEQDHRRWESLLNSGRQQELLDIRPPVSDGQLALQSAGLAFLWELSRRNPYVARVVSGAPVQWCELIASATLVKVLDCATGGNIIEARFEATSSSQQRLLQRGASALHEARVFAQIGALQTLLTGIDVLPYQRMPAAACRMPQTVQQVADEV